MNAQHKLKKNSKSPFFFRSTPNRILFVSLFRRSHPGLSHNIKRHDQTRHDDQNTKQNTRQHDTDSRECYTNTSAFVIFYYLSKVLVLFSSRLLQGCRIHGFRVPNFVIPVIKTFSTEF